MSLNSLPLRDQVGQAALVLERLAGHGRVVDQLVTHLLAEELVLRQLLVMNSR